MAAVIPEAAEAVSSGEGAVAGAGARARAGRGAHRGQPSKAEKQARGQLADRGKRAARGIDRAGRHDRQYQPVILAEFMVAILVTAVAPIAQGGDKTAQAKGGPSPYSSDTLKQLVAIGAAYFLLALLSGSKKYGRFTAWFGGLILLAVALNSFVTGGLTAIFGIFGPSPATPPAIPDTSQPQANPNLPGITTPGAPGAGIPGVGQDIGVNTQSVQFSQPGVATTTETTPGVTLTSDVQPAAGASTGTGIAGSGGVVRSPRPGLG